MTEHEAWLELARMFEPGKDMPRLSSGCTIRGICPAMAHLANHHRRVPYSTMIERLKEHFMPLNKHSWQFWWREGYERAARALACGLLAAMTE